MNDGSGIVEHTILDVGAAPADFGAWRCDLTVEKNDQDGHRFETYKNCNIRLIGGASLFWERAITKKPSTSSTGAALQALSTDNAVIGVSTSNTAAAKTQTALQGTNKAYSTQNSGYPAHTDGTGSTGAQDCQFQVSFGSGAANFAWNEVALANSSSGRHVNRIVQSLGTKTTGTWTLTLTLTETT